jgi:hypothetical protein
VDLCREVVWTSQRDLKGAEPWISDPLSRISRVHVPFVHVVVWLKPLRWPWIQDNVCSQALFVHLLAENVRQSIPVLDVSLHLVRSMKNVVLVMELDFQGHAPDTET